MTEREALLRAVIQAPDDTTRRLVYADWLDEHGESECAEFIRVDCELLRTPCTVMARDPQDDPPAVVCGPVARTNPRWRELHRRRRELLRYAPAGLPWAAKWDEYKAAEAPPA